METIIHVFFWIMTGVSILSTVTVFLTDILWEQRRFVWYHYVPCAVVNAVLGTLSPLLLERWFLMLPYGADAPTVLLIIGYFLLLVGNNAGFYIAFFRKESFARLFYLSASMTALFVVSYWLIRLFYHI